MGVSMGVAGVAVIPGEGGGGGGGARGGAGFELGGVGGCGRGGLMVGCLRLRAQLGVWIDGFVVA